MSKLIIFEDTKNRIELVVNGPRIAKYVVEKDGHPQRIRREGFQYLFSDKIVARSYHEKEDLAGLIGPWTDRLDAMEIDSGTTDIDGVPVSVYEDSSPHSSEVTQSLSVPEFDVMFCREGSKEISYDRWVDTNWSGWEVCV